MFTIFAHWGHSYDVNSTDMVSAVDHCMPIIVGAGLIIVALLGIILYFLSQWQPKTKPKAKSTAKKPRSTQK